MRKSSRKLSPNANVSLSILREVAMSHDVNPYAVMTPATIASEAVSGPPPTTAEFMQELDDLVAFNSHSPYVRRQFRRIWVAVGILMAFVFIAVGGLRAEMLFPLVIGLLVVAVLLAPPLVRRRVRRQYAKIFGHRLPRQQTVVLSNEGLFVRTPDAESCYFWRGIERIDMTPAHAFFYLMAIQAVVVPARAFRSEAQFQAFVNHARKLWAEAQHK
jgi:hypothetical protein